MSHRDKNKPKSRGGDNSVGKPLQPVSANASKSGHGSSTGIAKSLQGLSLVDKNGGRASTSLKGAQASRTRSTTVTQTKNAQNSFTESHEFIKVQVSGTFESDFQPAVPKSYMASSSSSSQMPGPQDGGSSAQDAKFVKSELFGHNFWLATKIAFGWSKNIALLGVLDTGAKSIFVNREMFESDFKQELDSSLVGNDKYMTSRFPDPIFHLETVHAPLHKSSFTLGGHNGHITLKEQSFYVMERAPFPVLVGLGTPTEATLHGHTLKDAPTLLQNIEKERGLRKIMGFDIFPWNDDENESDVLKGSSVDFGGKDESRYDNATIRYVGCSADYIIEPGKITYASPGGKPVTLQVKVPAVVDSGSPFIVLPMDLWRKFAARLRVNGVTVFDHDHPRLKTIEEKDFAKLRTLSFHLVDVDGSKFAIDIPPAGQVFPPSFGRKYAGVSQNDRLALTVVPIPGFEVVCLGVPLFQRYYVGFDLTTNPYRIGFAAKEKTHFVNPSLQEILKKYPRLPQILPKPEQSGK